VSKKGEREAIKKKKEKGKKQIQSVGSKEKEASFNESCAS
jgi:hypothetical protein